MSGARAGMATDMWGSGTPDGIDHADRRPGDGGRFHRIDRIWTVRGVAAVAPGRAAADILQRLAPLLDQPGTTCETTGDTLTFRKKDQAAQDRMSVFDSGTMRVEAGGAGPVLRYRLVSRALLFCFLLPLLFLGFAGMTIALNYVRSPVAGARADRKPEAKKTPDVPMNPIDKALGAPAPEKKADKDKAEDDSKPTPTAAYIFAGMFALLYIIGRVHEARKVKALIRQAVGSA